MPWRGQKPDFYNSTFSYRFDFGVRYTILHNYKHIKFLKNP